MNYVLPNKMAELANMPVEFLNAAVSSKLLDSGQHFVIAEDKKTYFDVDAMMAWIKTYIRGRGQRVDEASKEKVIKDGRIARATPLWAKKRKINKVYALVGEYNTRYPEEAPFHVDHIIPLNHPLVCGLHVHYNLQVLAARDNLRKNNSFQIGVI